MRAVIISASRRHALRVRALLAALLLVAGPAWAAELRVHAASSLTEPFRALAAQFEQQHPGVKVQLSFAGSQALRTQIEQGAAVDVFASADREQLEPLVARKLALEPRVFAHNELVMVVAKDARIASLRELPEARTLVVGAPSVPVGAYTKELLARADRAYGAHFAERVEARVASRELNVRQVLAKVVLGEADAGFVYRSDAASAAGKVKVIELPPELRVRAEYPIAQLTSAADPRLARAFVALVLSPAGAEALRAAGFSR